MMGGIEPHRLSRTVILLGLPMAFMIEQPERASDVQAGFLAGILGALKAYAKVCELEPASRSPFLDHMLDLQKSGELEAFYRKACAPAP
jgi:hypothetical protein